jgi:hypothetical protein
MSHSLIFDLDTIIADALSVFDVRNVMKEALKSDTLKVDHLVIPIPGWYAWC